MSRTLLITLCLLATTVATTGCTTARALRHNTVSQANTVADIHQQQVLDNLAKFVHDPYAIPSFAVANAGTAMLSDGAGGALGFSWTNTALSSVMLGGDASRGVQDTWTTTPITNPRQLELMRCAYQRVISQCGCGFEAPACPDCKKRFNEFYTGRAVGSRLLPDATTCYSFDENGRPSNLVEGPVDDECLRFGPCKCESPSDLPNVACDCRTVSPGSGIVNSECLNSPCCWLRCGCKSCVPKHCQHVGHYCGTYVWVPCGPGRNELAKLTLAILDYAVNEAQQLPQKEVTLYLDASGCPAETQKEAPIVVRAQLPTSTPSISLLRADLAAKSAVQEILRSGGCDTESFRVALAKDVERLATMIIARDQMFYKNDKQAEEQQKLLGQIATDEPFAQQEAIDRLIDQLEQEADRGKIQDADDLAATLGLLPTAEPLVAPGDSPEEQTRSFQLDAPAKRLVTKTYLDLQALRKAKATSADVIRRLPPVPLPPRRQLSPASGGLLLLQQQLSTVNP